MSTAFYSHPACRGHDMGAGHPECPQRLDAITDHLLATGLDVALDYREAMPATMEQIARAHTSSYVSELADLLQQVQAAGAPRALDPDTIAGPGTLQAALHAAGAAVAATDDVLAGRARNAFCAVRPPGHHATRDVAMGFCFFNNVAIAARHALDVHGLQRVALIDFDVHHGNGSEDIFRGDDRVLMCSVFENGLYPFTGEDATGPNMVNVGLPSRSGGEALRDAVTRHWLPALEAFRPQMLFISAGFDAHREDDMGNLGFVEADYAWVTRQLMAVAQTHAGGRVVSCLEGGYVMSPLARSVAAHVKVLIGAD